MLNKHLHKDAIHTLWTGGWDSTYRIVELSRMDVTVLPIYCCDPERDSTTVEKKTILRILEALSARPETKAHFYPVQYIDVNAIPENKEITAAFRVLNADGSLGSEYEWLARLALEYPGLEVGIEKANQENSIIHKYGKLKTDHGVSVLDPENSTPECNLVMGNFHFPIIGITETEMLEKIKAWGYEDIMAMIWFCHNPMKGHPCGMCIPCQQKMEESMGALLPEAAHRRYRIYKKTEKRFGSFIAKALAAIVYRNFL